jgi:hypothetical protein
MGSCWARAGRRLSRRCMKYVNQADTLLSCFRGNGVRKPPRHYEGATPPIGPQSAAERDSKIPQLPPGIWLLASVTQVSPARNGIAVMIATHTITKKAADYS